MYLTGTTGPIDKLRTGPQNTNYTRDHVEFVKKTVAMAVGPSLTFRFTVQVIKT
jgi:hypothetical protein